MSKVKIYDSTNFRELIGNTTRERYEGYDYDVAEVDGHKRFLSRFETDNGRKHMAAMPLFADNFPTFSREEIFERVKAQEAGALMSIERCQAMYKIQSHDQDGLPTCWANGPAHAFTTMRCMMGLPLVYISACSLAVPISGGHVGGDEADAGEYLQKYGGASFDAWSNNDTSRSLNSDPNVVESRKYHIAFQTYALSGTTEQRQLQLATAYTMDRPMTAAFAYFWWSHVISGGRIKFTGSTASSTMTNVQENNWGDPWGDRNIYLDSIGGYVTLAEGSHGTPGSGFVFGPVLQSAA